MTQKTRIVLNTIASYGRSMFSAACGIFSARWVLMALGKEDYGLFGLVGSLVIFITFLNVQFSSSISRYYAYSVGRAKAKGCDSNLALNDCRSWFTVALALHMILPLLLVGIGYPIGRSVISSGVLNIPTNRIDACLWLWAFVCLSAFVGMMNVPFHAMYTAKQLIAELTVYSVVQTAIRTVFVYYMTLTEKDWLVTYGFMMMLVAITPQLIICARALCIFPECRLRLMALKEFWRVRKLGVFAFWSGIGGLGYVASHQCMSIIINKNYGPRITGAFNISQTVAAEAGMLTGALQGAFQPAITTAYGAGEIDKVKFMAFEICKVGTFLTMLFALPMAIEVEELLSVWLKDPPEFAAGMCAFTLCFIVIEKLSYGQLAAINATGNIAKFQALRGVLRTTVIPCAIVLIVLSRSADLAVAALPISAATVVVGDVLMGRKVTGIGFGLWLRKVVVPIFLIAIVSGAIGFVPHYFMVPSIWRIIVASFSVTSVLAVTAWLVLFTKVERDFLCSCARNVFAKFLSPKMSKKE